MHLMIGIIGISAAFILDESEPGIRVRPQKLDSLAQPTYRRLEGVRGAGISQRTRRP